MAISPQRLTIYLYSAHRAVIFAIAQLSCCCFKFCCSCDLGLSGAISPHCCILLLSVTVSTQRTTAHFFMSPWRGWPSKTARDWTKTL